MSHYQLWDERSKIIVFAGRALGIPYSVLAKMVDRTPEAVQKMAQRNKPPHYVRGLRKTYKELGLDVYIRNKQEHIAAQYLLSELEGIEAPVPLPPQAPFLEIIQKAEEQAKFYKDTHAEIEDARTAEAYARSLDLPIRRVPLDTSPTSYGYRLDRLLCTPGQILLKINQIRESLNLMPLIVIEWLGEV